MDLNGSIVPDYLSNSTALSKIDRKVEEHLQSESFQARRGSNQNIVHKLRQRQLLLGYSDMHNRSFYHCIVPNYTEQGVQPPSGFLRKFSPDGHFLLAFSNNQRNVLVYNYLGASVGQTLFYLGLSQEDIKLNLFDCFFKKRFSIPVALNDEHLNRECSLFTEDCQHVVVVSSAVIPEENYPDMLSLFTTNESLSFNAQIPLEDYTLYLVDIVRGIVTDSRPLKCDKIYLSHNQGLSLCNSTLAVLSILHQTIHLFEIIDGTFIALQQIGRFCYPDDVEVCSENYIFGPDRYHDAMSVHPFLERWYCTLKHRLLCFLIKEAENLSTPTNPSPLENIFKRFNFLRSLRIGKMQLLDESHLLLKYSDIDVVTLNHSDPSSQQSLYVIYDIDTTQIISIHENTSKELLEIYENNADSFRAPVSHPMCRNISSLSNNYHCRALHRKFKQTITSAKYGGSEEATRRLLGQLPVCSQSFSSSPYLDLALFSYDDKWASPVERPKPCGDNPIK